MAYSKTVWNNNTPPDISAENLNKMEQGIADAQFPDGGSTGQILSKTNDGTGWVDAPNSAEWGNIDGQLSEQTDLYSELESKITMPSGGTTGQVLTKTASGQAWQDASGGGNVDTVNGISPNAQKNVEVDIELTKAEYDALPSSKLTDDVNYWIKDGTNLPQTSVISADGVMYTDSQTVKGALDGLTTFSTGTLTANEGVTLEEPAVYKYGRICTVSCAITLTANVSAYTRLVEIPAGFRPYRQMFRDCGSYSYDVTSSGAIRTRTSMSSGAKLYVAETFIVQ